MTIPNYFDKAEQRAKFRLINFKEEQLLATKRMYEKCGFNETTPLFLTESLNENNTPIHIDFKFLKTAMIFSNQFVCSLIDSKKIHIGKSGFAYQNKKLKLGAKRSHKVGISLDNYYISEIGGEIYLHILHSNFLYKNKDFIDMNKNIQDLLLTEPYDISVNISLIIDNKIPFTYYRLDNNNEFKTPHPNRMKDGKVLSIPEFVIGPHEHIYDETFAVLFREYPLSFDAKPLYSRRQDMSTTIRPPLTMPEINFLLQNKLNLEEINIEESFSENFFDFTKVDEFMDRVK